MLSHAGSLGLVISEPVRPIFALASKSAPGDDERSLVSLSVPLGGGSYFRESKKIVSVYLLLAVSVHSVKRYCMLREDSGSRDILELTDYRALWLLVLIANTVAEV